MTEDMKWLAVPHHNDLWKIVALRSVKHEREERDCSFLAGLQGLSCVCELSIKCTKVGCVEKLSYTEKEILNTLVQGMFDVETRG